MAIEPKEWEVEITATVRTSCIVTSSDVDAEAVEQHAIEAFKSALLAQDVLVTMTHTRAVPKPPPQ
jgi:hypothetical protein